MAAKHIGLNPKSASLRDLLSVFLAAPSVLPGEKASAPEITMIVAFVLLASMSIVASGRRSLVPITGTRMSGVLLRGILKDAIVWMDAQMPGYVFHRDIEKYIRSAAELRYATSPEERRTVQTTTA